jgi:hypothetical protein
MDREALRREAIGWFRSRLAADDWMEALRAQTRPLRAVKAEAGERSRPKRTRTKVEAA